jgi:undecaprenyl-diphosphatase
MGALDRAIFYAINRWPESQSGFWVFFSEATKNPVTRILLVVLVVVLCLSGKATRKATLIALAAWPLADAFSGLFKNVIPFDRPCVALPDVLLRVHKLTTYGTASSHAANMAAIAFVFAYYTGWKGGVPWVIVAFLTGLSRIYVGVHFPSQVLFGWLCGAFIGFLVVKTWDALVRLRTAKRNPEAEPAVEEA